MVGAQGVQPPMLKFSKKVGGSAPSHDRLCFDTAKSHIMQRGDHICFIAAKSRKKNRFVKKN